MEYSPGGSCCLTARPLGGTPRCSRPRMRPLHPLPTLTAPCCCRCPGAPLPLGRHGRHARHASGPDPEVRVPHRPHRRRRQAPLRRLGCTAAVPARGALPEEGRACMPTRRKIRLRPRQRAHLHSLVHFALTGMCNAPLQVTMDNLKYDVNDIQLWKVSKSRLTWDTVLLTAPDASALKRVGRNARRVLLYDVSAEQRAMHMSCDRKY